MNTNMSPQEEDAGTVLSPFSFSFFQCVSVLITGHWSDFILVSFWHYWFLFPEGLYGLLF